ncbi:type IV secretion system DNA-binding domain-containing protein, partial [Candidatus Sumerlaeota bacterium]|nr:type IV secretion system DNA-binding domain-containing protein [Candidatus Sumerlaeota bacterium]
MITDPEKLADLIGRNDKQVRRVIASIKRNPWLAKAGCRLLEEIARKKGIDLVNPPAFRTPERYELPVNSIYFGHTENNDAVSLKCKDGHLLAVGVTGSGKTTLLTRIIEECLKRGDYVNVFDYFGGVYEY